MTDCSYLPSLKEDSGLSSSTGSDEKKGNKRTSKLQKQKKNKELAQMELAIESTIN